MKYPRLTLLNAIMLLCLCGCGNPGKHNAKESPAFMAGCYREEVVTSEYYIPAMTTPEIATYIQNLLKGMMGHVKSEYDLSTRTLSVSYASSTIRSMNIEEAIAYSGFEVNSRPANPAAKLPEGLSK